MSTMNKFLVWFFIIGMLNNACRKEEIINQTGPENQGIAHGTQAAELIRRVTMHDGSFDNIVDRANHFSIKMPYTVIVDGQSVTVQSVDDLEDVEDILDDSDSYDIQIVFPVTLVFYDYSEVTVQNASEFTHYQSQTPGENVPDDDIECVDFVYPVALQIFNTVTEQNQNLISHNDKELFQWVDGLDGSSLLIFSFPIVLQLSDGTQVNIQNVEQMVQTIENHVDDCDEDDDFDYNDDDCAGCTTQQLINLLTGCQDWELDELKRNGTDLSDTYEDYSLHFINGGTLEVTYQSQTFTGQWSASVSNGQIVLHIQLNSVPDFSADWLVEEMDDAGQDKKVKLYTDDQNKMKLESDCQ